MHEDNSFITLTFNDEHIPDDRSLDIVVFQKFMKRLRRRLSPILIRFYACGEYGEIYGRPHYHACVFGYAFPDKRPWKESNGITIYRSALLEDVWPFGYSSIGDVSFQSAAYVARYLLKKINGPDAGDHYEYINPETGEIRQLKPEYTNMSRRPGIGSTFLDKFMSDIYPSDFVVINNKKMRPPRFYDAKFELFSPKEHAQIKGKRKRDAIKNQDDNTPERLAVKMSVQKSKLKHLPRKVE